MNTCNLRLTLVLYHFFFSANLDCSISISIVLSESATPDCREYVLLNRMLVRFAIRIAFYHSRRSGNLPKYR